jgi:hypothetical protein
MRYEDDGTHDPVELVFGVLDEEGGRASEALEVGNGGGMWIPRFLNCRN